MGAPEQPVDRSRLPVDTGVLRNYWWPFGGVRLIWQGGIGRILSGPYDVVICQQVIHNLSVWRLRLRARRHGKRLVILGHGYRAVRSTVRVGARMFAAMQRFLLSGADSVITYSERGRQHVLALGLDPTRVFVSYNTLDTEALSAIGDIPVSAVSPVAQAARAPMLLFVGRLLPEKRCEVLLEAIRILNNQGLDVSAVIVGSGSAREDLELAAAGLPNVRFAGAIYDESELAALFKEASLLVIPGRVGLTCVHGFAYGVPIVTSRDGAVNQSPEYDYIRHSFNGWVIDEPNGEALASAVELLLETPDLMNRLHGGATETAQELRMDRMVSQFALAIRKAVE
ncbi:MAG TPA: glycosyltransferase family 4 protein [Acidimicrobiia bacterium]